MLYSAHAIIRMNQVFLFNQEHEDFGYLLPGGKFKDYNYVDFVYGEQKASEWVVLREIGEELGAKPADINFKLQKYLGWKPDDIKTKSGKTYHVDKMFFWTASVDTKINFEELQARANIPLRRMSISEVKKEVLSPAMVQMVQDVYLQNT